MVRSWFVLTCGGVVHLLRHYSGILASKEKLKEKVPFDSSYSRGKPFMFRTALRNGGTPHLSALLFFLTFS